MRKVLIITYHFPPSTAVGGIRPAKFAKYLPQFGWEPIILTIPQDSSGATDQGRLRDVAGCPIHRAAPLPTPLDFYHSIKPALQRGRAKGAPTLTTLPLRSAAADARPPRLWTVLRRTGARYFSTFFETPDKEVGWLIPAVVHGLRVIRRERVDVLFATSPPTTPAVVGLALSMLSGRPLVTDLRDPFILHAAKPADQRTWISDIVERWLERRILRRSRRIITTTALLAQALHTRFPQVLKDAIRTITNGFDPDDFGSLPAEPRDGSRFVLSYLGTFYFGRTPRELLLAMGELVREGAVDRRDLRVEFCGDVETVEGRPVWDLVREAGLADCVAVRGHVSYRDALLQMRRSSVLVLLAPDQPLQIPGKAFEYLGARRRILCVSSAGATADLIRASGAGHLVAPGDVAGLKRVLRELYDAWRSGQLVNGSADTSVYDRRRLAEQLAALLQSLVPNGEEHTAAIPSVATPAAPRREGTS